MAEKTPQEVEFDKAKKYGGDTRSRMKTAYGKIRAAAEAGDLALCRKLLDDFKAEASKLPGIYARMQRAVEAFKRMVAEGAAPASAAAVVFPNDLEGLVDGGSAELDGAARSKVTDASGRVWFKRTKDDAAGGMEQLESETAADAVYAGFGIMTPASRMYGDAKLTEDVGGVPLAAYLEGSASDAEKEAARRQFVEGLDVDCMLANWSCVGGNDRRDFAVIRDGKVYRTATYGAMAFRVKGGKKGSGGWGDDPTDYFKLWTYANQQAVLGDMKVSALGLMKRTLGRSWDGALAKMSDEDRAVVEKRLENVGKVVAYGDELMRDDPDKSVDELNEELEAFVKNKYRKPKKLEQYPADMSKKRVMVEATDLSREARTGGELKKKLKMRKDVSGRRNHTVMERMMHDTGVDGLPMVVKDMDEFKKLSPHSMGFRTIGADDVEQMEQMVRALKDGTDEGDFYIRCSGGSAHGLGMYVATFNHTRANKSTIDAARRDSNCYGNGNVRCEFTIGMTDDFRWISESDAVRMRDSEADEEIRNMDIGNYALYKGYDGIYTYDMGGGYTYSVVYNRSKCVILDKVRYLKD